MNSADVHLSLDWMVLGKVEREGVPAVDGVLDTWLQNIPRDG